MNPHWKRALRITGWVFLAMLILVIAISYRISQEKIGTRRMEARVKMMGQGVGTMTSLILFPFWLIAASRVRKEKLAAIEAKKASSND
jgi:hypothetical protein